MRELQGDEALYLVELEVIGSEIKLLRKTLEKVVDLMESRIGEEKK